MPFVRGPVPARSDPALLEIFRKLVRACPADEPTAPWALLLIWDGQPGVDRDDLIDILKDECGPGSVARPGG